MLNERHHPDSRAYWLLGLAVFLAAVGLVLRTASLAQEAGEEDTGPTPAFSDSPDSAPLGDEGATAPVAEEGPLREKIEGINVFTLLVKGGFFMVPIFLMSLLVVTFIIERFIALRRERVLPNELIVDLGKLGGSQGSFDPRQAYRICQKHPSSASSVIRAMLLKVGRPHSEVEHAVAEASEREADRIYGNVRWLNLAAAVTPLMGLLGTVWGMIRAFHDTTQLAPGQNKADYLAEGIYVALVTTLGGLVVAIPAAIFAHYFEGKVTRLFHEIDELLFNLMPQVERYEGRVRFSQKLADEQPSAAATGDQQQPAATVTG
jgi:biopolymer transport protein ExbB